jgi:hypothetical protein
MIFAELRGKLRDDYSLAHERAEDLLTSSVFQLLRYLPPEQGLLPLLLAARTVRQPWVAFGAVDAVDVELWPSFGSAGQPDVLLHLFSERRQTHAILIEAKLYAGKSGRSAPDDSGGNGNTHEHDLADHGPAVSAVTHRELVHERDQLVKYWQELQRRYIASEIATAIVYLTAHLTPPLADLDESFALDGTMKLGWLSWYDICRIAADISHRSPKDLPAKDLAELLHHRGFGTFRGFRDGLRPALPASPRFFWTALWFACASDWRPSPLRHFWRQS